MFTLLNLKLVSRLCYSPSCLALCYGTNFLMLRSHDDGLGPATILEVSEITNGMDAEMSKKLSSSIRDTLKRGDGSIDNILEGLGLVGLVHNGVNIHDGGGGTVATHLGLGESLESAGPLEICRSRGTVFIWKKITNKLDFHTINFVQHCIVLYCT